MITSAPSAAPECPLGGELSPETLRRLILIRRFEELLLAAFQAGKINGTTHTCLGQEYVPVAVMPLLRDDDFVFSNHRGHGHYLARYDDPDGLLAEIMGRAGAICNGVGGSQHIRRDRYFSTGIQGESLPVAVGAALQLKREGRGALAMPFIGDGTWGQGAVYEALNMASLWRVPLAVVVENNRIAQTTHSTANMAGAIEARVRAFGIDYLRLTGHNVTKLAAAVAPALERVRHHHAPLVIEFETHRLGSHSKGDDTRPVEEVQEMRRRSWWAEVSLADPATFAEIDAEVRVRLQAVADRLETSSPSTWSRA